MPEIQIPRGLQSSGSSNTDDGPFHYTSSNPSTPNTPKTSDSSLVAEISAFILLDGCVTSSMARHASRIKREKSSTYLSGQFGTESKLLNETEDVCAACIRVNCRIGRSTRMDRWVGCYKCLLWFHAKCVKITLSKLADNAFFCVNCI